MATNNRGRVSDPIAALSGSQTQSPRLCRGMLTSVTARHFAASELVRTLRRQRWKNPDVHQVVIGHSHGGSVALLAMRDFQDKEVKATKRCSRFQKTRAYERMCWSAGNSEILPERFEIIGA